MNKDRKNLEAMHELTYEDISRDFDNMIANPDNKKDHIIYEKCYISEDTLAKLEAEGKTIFLEANSSHVLFDYRILV